MKGSLYPWLLLLLALLRLCERTESAELMPSISPSAAALPFVPSAARDDETRDIPQAVDTFQLWRCPHTAWSFPSELTSTANLTPLTNASHSNNVWTCGYKRGLRLESNATDVLETNLLGNSYWSHFTKDSNAFTTSVWFNADNTTLDETDPKLYPLLTWAIAPSEVHRHTGCPGYYLQIAIFRAHLLIRYSDQDVSMSCKALYLRQEHLEDLVDPEINMLVLILEKGKTLVYLNGRQLQKTAPNSFVSTPIASWKKSRLRVFGTSLSSNIFRGSMHEISLYNKTLSKKEILQLYSEGIESFRNPNGPAAMHPIALALAQPADIELVQADDREISIELLVPEHSAIASAVLSLFLEVQVVPLHGSLVKESDGTNVLVRDRLPISRDAPLQERIIFKLSTEDFFNTPNQNALGERLPDGIAGDEKLVYSVVAVDDDGFDVTSSTKASTAVQSIRVRHKNHVPELYAPAEATWTETNHSDFTFLCDGIRLEDQLDYDIDLVRVDVSARHGRLTLNPDFRYSADFDSCRGRTKSSWQCLGDGVVDRQMTFLTIPSRVQLILGDLEYEGFNPGVPDEIVISIYDGADSGDCLSTSEHLEYSRVAGRSSGIATAFDECYKVSATIKVPEIEDLETSVGSNDDETGVLGIPNSDPQKFDLADLAFWIFLAAFACALCFCCGRTLRQAAQFCRARGGAIAIDGSPPLRHGARHPAPAPRAETTTDDISNRVVVFVSPSSRTKYLGDSSVAGAEWGEEDSRSDLDSSLTDGSEPSEMSV